MKLLLKLYLLGQLIALPFMVGAIGGALGDDNINDRAANDQFIAQTNKVIGGYAKLCNVLDINPVAGTSAYDELDELNKVSSQPVFGPTPTDQCADGTAGR